MSSSVCGPTWGTGYDLYIDLDSPKNSYSYLGIKNNIYLFNILLLLIY